MAFSTRRGRPKKNVESHDLGTHELQQKRKCTLTAEPLDICLDKGILTEQQHWCGIHLRWLYTLRYGAPNISCHDITAREYGAMRNDDPEWRAKREYEYHEAAAMHHQHKHYDPVMRLAVYHEPPIFLHARMMAQRLENPALSRRIEAERLNLISGFKALESLWCKAANQPKSGESITTKQFCGDSLDIKSISSLVH